MARKLDGGEKHFLRLISEGQARHGGWAKVSKPLYPLVAEMPSELVEREPLPEGGGRARLTPRGEALLEAMAWL